LAIGLGVVVCLWFVFWLVQRCYNWLARSCNRVLAIWWERLLTLRLARWLAIPGDRMNPSPLARFIWFLVAAIIFIFLLACILDHGAIAALNWPAFKFMQSLRGPVLDSFFSIVTLIGSPKAMLALMVLIGVWYWVQKDWRHLFFWLLGIILVGGAVGLFKIVIPEPRPLGFNMVAHSNGFPSGHTALSTVAFGLLAFWVTLEFEMTWRSAWRVLTVFVLFLIGVSRLYLGAHWLWDVIAGWSLAAAVWLFVTALYRRTPDSGTARFQGCSRWVILLLVLLSSLFFAWRGYAKELYRTTPIWEKRTETLLSWLHSPHQGIPQYFENRIGNQGLPMNIQWLGHASCIRKQLKKMGWQPAHSAWDIANLVKRFTLKRAQDHLPLFVRRYQGKLPDVVFVRPAEKANDILELYLWTSGVKIQGSGSHVLVGFLNQRSAKDSENHVDSIAKIQYRSGNLGSQFSRDLGSSYRYKRVKVVGLPATKTVQGWAGDTWLIYPRSPLREGSRICR